MNEYIHTQVDDKIFTIILEYRNVVLLRGCNISLLTTLKVLLDDLCEK
jgi:hypothetical protein